MYWKEGMTQEAIGERIGRSQQDVSVMLRSLGIATRRRGSSNAGWSADWWEKRRKRIHWLYFEDDRCLEEVARELAVDAKSVWNWMHKWGWSLRTRSETQRIKARWRWLDRKNEIMDMLAQGWTCKQIGEHYHVHESTADKWIRKLKLRSLRQKKRGSTKFAIDKLYWGWGLSAAEIGKRLGVAESTVLRRMDKYGIPKRGRRGRGKAVERGAGEALLG